MQIIEVKQFGKKRWKIFFEEKEPLVLYYGECKKYHIQDGGDLSERDYQEIVSEILYKRARERMLYLIDSMDRTESQIREKLIQGGYPSACIDQVISFGKRYRYLDDERYIHSYYQVKKRKKSLRAIEQDLMLKGISKELIREKLREVLEEDEEQKLMQADFEEEQIQRFFEKKRKKILESEDTYKEWQKACQSLYRKGFSYDKVCRVMERLKNEL